MQLSTAADLEGKFIPNKVLEPTVNLEPQNIIYLNSIGRAWSECPLALGYFLLANMLLPPLLYFFWTKILKGFRRLLRRLVHYIISHITGTTENCDHFRHIRGRDIPLRARMWPKHFQADVCRCCRQSWAHLSVETRWYLTEAFYWYGLLPINAAFFAWAVLCNYAYVMPTEKNVFWIRSVGGYTFNIIFLTCIISCSLVGILNMITVSYVWNADKRRTRRWTKILKFFHIPPYFPYSFYVGIVVVVAFIGLPLPLAAGGFRDVFVAHYYKNACDNYHLMADIYVLPTFPSSDGRRGKTAFDSSSRISFYKEGRYTYTMDLVKTVNQTLGLKQFSDVHAMQANHRFHELVHPTNGTFNLTLLTLAEEPSRHGDGTPIASTKWDFFNTSELTRTSLLGKEIEVPGPVANIQYSLSLGHYNITFTNLTAPGFPASRKNGTFNFGPNLLQFPELLLQQAESDRKWRFTDSLCLPPRVALRNPVRLNSDVVGGFRSLDCRHYRMCGLRKKYNGGGHGEDWKTWWDWVENVWPTVVGVVAWEVEAYCPCCRNSD